MNYHELEVENHMHLFIHNSLCQKSGLVWLGSLLRISQSWNQSSSRTEFLSGGYEATSASTIVLRVGRVVSCGWMSEPHFLAASESCLSGFLLSLLCSPIRLLTTIGILTLLMLESLISSFINQSKLSAIKVNVIRSDSLIMCLL